MSERTTRVVTVTFTGTDDDFDRAFPATRVRAEGRPGPGVDVTQHEALAAHVEAMLMLSTRLAREVGRITFRVSPDPSPS